MSTRPTWDQVGLVLIWGVILGSGVGVVFFRPLFDRLAPTCYFRLLTGILTPGCGLTRAIRALASGDLLAAIDFNPLAVISLPLVGYELVVATSRAFKGPRMWSLFDGPRAPVIVAAVVIAYFVARNLPFWPFLVLRP